MVSSLTRQSGADTRQASLRATGYQLWADWLPGGATLAAPATRWVAQTGQLPAVRRHRLPIVAPQMTLVMRFAPTTEFRDHKPGPPVPMAAGYAQATSLQGQSEAKTERGIE